MAQYNLAANTQFKPFSYERYLAPMLAYNDALQSQEDLISELSTQSNVWEHMANKQTDVKAYAQYKKYADDLKAQANTLAETGLYEGSRRALLDLKNRYSTEITPIENAYKTRLEQIKMQQQMKQAHPDILYGRTASTTSLDKYLEDPSYDATMQVASGEQLRNQVGQAAAALAKEAHENPNIQKTLQKVLPYQYYGALESTGFKSEDVLAAINNTPEGSAILKGIVDKVITGAGIDKWDDKSMYQQAWNAAAPGLYNAVGTTKYGQFTDQAGLATLQADLALRNQKQQQKWQEEQAAKQAGNDYNPDYPVDTQEVTFGSDSKKVEKDYNNFKAIMGISGGNGGSKVGYHDIEVKSGGRNGGYVISAFNKNGSKKFRVYDKKTGMMYSENQFASQGKTKQDQDVLRNYYRNKMMPALASMGINKNTRHVSNQYKTGYAALTRGGATYQTMPRLNFADNTKTFDNKLAGLIQSTGGVYEIGSSLKDYRSGHRKGAKDIKEELKEGDTIGFYPSFSKGTEGLVITAGEKRYFMPAANMTSSARGAFKNYANTVKEAESRKASIKSHYKAMIQKYGQREVDAELANIDRYLKWQMATGLRDIGWAIDGEYATPSAKLFQQPSISQSSLTEQ